jgi:hypothetical protein
MSRARRVLDRIALPPPGFYENDVTGDGRADMLGLLNIVRRGLGVDPRNGTPLTDEYMADQIKVDAETFKMWVNEELPQGSSESLETTKAVGRWLRELKRETDRTDTGLRTAPVPFESIAATSSAPPERSGVTTDVSPFGANYVRSAQSYARDYVGRGRGGMSAGYVSILVRGSVELGLEQRFLLRYKDGIRAQRGDSARDEFNTGDLERVATVYTRHAQATLAAARRLLFLKRTDRGDDYEFYCTRNLALRAVSEAVDVAEMVLNMNY